MMKVVTIDEMLKKVKEKAQSMRRHIFGAEYVEAFKETLEEYGKKGHRFLTLIYSKGLPDGGGLLFDKAEKGTTYTYEVEYIDKFENAQNEGEFTKVLKDYELIIGNVMFYPQITKPLIVSMRTVAPPPATK